ncbi:MAG: prepilin-type N-terminal cleavage/methylation domain-containing protein [Clostridiales bacterium]|jgi:prepilin-type N-terminal cleavage/methylation domain-containing protein|nr:prepilin-type N-terminal cleavage/methylation domain-containing protein [Clostridiales bacterium]
MRRRNYRQKNKNKGFTLLEVVIGIALIAIAVLGLAEMFTLSVMNNMRSDRITTASFLAQQRVDVLRNLTAGELAYFTSNASIDLNNDGTPDLLKDELIDLNGDTQNDYRRLTRIRNSTEFSGEAWDVDVFIFSAEQFGKDQSALLGDPQRHRVRARVSTIISR